MTTFTSTGARSDTAACAGRDRFNSPLTIFAARNVCRSIFSSSRVFGSCGSAPSSSICVKLEIPVSGVLTSWATPAASRPIDAIFSEICSCSSSCTRTVTSSMITIEPTVVAPAGSTARSGITAALTMNCRSSPACTTGERHARQRGAGWRIAARGADRLDEHRIEHLVEALPVASSRETPYSCSSA